MKYLITEEQYKKFIKSSPELQNMIKKYLDKYFLRGERKITHKSRNYGNLREDWCVNGNEIATAIYFYNNKGIFNDATLIVGKTLVDEIKEMFNVKISFIIHVIEEWYEETMVPKFEKIVGESGLYITDIDVNNKVHVCVPEPVKPEGITDEEMIDFIDKNTGYKRDEIIHLIQTGKRELEDFYLDILDMINRRKITGF